MIPSFLTAWLAEPPPDVQEQVAPYLMPLDHPIKPILDEIFGTIRVTTNLNTLKESGFYDIQLRKRGIVFARHVQVPGYIFKLVCDNILHSYNKYEKSYRKQDEHIEFIGRIQKRNEIVSLIRYHQINRFTAPKKWIYPIPPEVEAKKGKRIIKKFYLLVAEEIAIVPMPDCSYLWNQLDDKEFLKDYYLIVRDARLCDIGPPNQSFTKEGNLAFIDTKNWPDKKFDILRATKFLSREMAQFWRILVENDNLQ